MFANTRTGAECGLTDYSLDQLLFIRNLASKTLSVSSVPWNLELLKKCSLRWHMLNIFHDTRFRPLGFGWIIRPSLLCQHFYVLYTDLSLCGNLTSCPLFSILFLWRYSCLPFFIVLCTDLSYMSEILPIRSKTLCNQSMIFLGWSMSRGWGVPRLARRKRNYQY